MRGLRLHGSLETCGGLFQRARRARANSQTVVRASAPRVDAQGRLVGLGSLVCAAARFQNITQVEEVVRIRRDRDGLADGFLRACRIALGGQREPQQIPTIGVVRLHRDCLAEQAGGLRVLAGLMRHDSEQIKRVGLPRIARQYGPISSRRLRQSPRAVMYRSFSQFVRFRPHAPRIIAESGNGAGKPKRR